MQKLEKEKEVYELNKLKQYNEDIWPPGGDKIESSMMNKSYEQNVTPLSEKHPSQSASSLDNESMEVEHPSARNNNIVFDNEQPDRLGDVTHLDEPLHSSSRKNSISNDTEVPLPNTMEINTTETDNDDGQLGINKNDASLNEEDKRLASYVEDNKTSVSSKPKADDGNIASMNEEQDKVFRQVKPPGCTTTFYQCKICLCTFISRWSLSQHMNLKHQLKSNGDPIQFSNKQNKDSQRINDDEDDWWWDNQWGFDDDKPKKSSKHAGHNRSRSPLRKRKNNNDSMNAVAVEVEQDLEKDTSKIVEAAEEEPSSKPQSRKRRRTSKPKKDKKTSAAPGMPYILDNLTAKKNAKIRKTQQKEEEENDTTLDLRRGVRKRQTNRKYANEDFENWIE